MKNTAMAVGHIPSLTWNHLRANCAELEETPFLSQTAEYERPELPEGITRTQLSAQDAEDWLRRNAPEELPESVTAGKVPIYHPQRLGTGLGKEFDDLLNASGVSSELLEVAPGVKAEHPVHVKLSFADGEHSALRQLIHVGEGSSLTLIISARSAAGEGTAALSTKIILEKDARLFLVKAQLLGDGFVFLDDTGAALGENASLRMVQAELGGGQVYVGTQPELIGDRSSYETKTGYLGKGDRRIDVNYNVLQRGRKTSAQMSFDGVLDDTCEKTFRGTIDFRKGSKGSKGDEQENVLLLSDDIVNKTLPIILCEEEDVEGRHGASIGQLDADMLFYMAARGIDRKEAEQIMVRARLGAVVREIPDLALRAELMNKIEEAFAR